MKHNLDTEKHTQFTLDYQELQRNPKVIEIKLLEHLTVSAYYWGVCTMRLLTKETLLDEEAIARYVMDCYHSNGGFSGAIGHDPHLLYTLSAIQILVMLNKLDLIDIDLTAKQVASLQQLDGSFVGDDLLEVDTRFSFCAIASLSLLKRLDLINKTSAIDYILKCQNFDGGFGSQEGSESHGGQIYTCLGALTILDYELDEKASSLLGWWLSERQLPCGGMNGRPQKKEDVCYSWWNISSLAMINKLDWIDAEAMRAFILACQCPTGGIAHQPNQSPDLFHTLFGLCGLSLLGNDTLSKIHPVYCMPQEVIDSHFKE